jgi:two-component system, chemotaxis family, protein-glutamate methylesterase/glutaminase
MLVTPDIIVIGASAGGVSALRKLIASLPDSLEASLFVVQHSHADGPEQLAKMLQTAGGLKASYAEDKAPFAPGHLYLAPADHHLLLEPGMMRVVRGPKENRHRPAIDPLFRSAAVHYGPRTVGVVLTGILNDGTAGLAAVNQCGGITVVQDPEDADAPEMPASAQEHVTVDHCVPMADMAALLAKLVHTPTEMPAVRVPKKLETEAKIPGMQEQRTSVVDELGERSTLTCPDCGGVLWKMDDERLLRFRCHLGHAMTAQVLAESQRNALDQALWLSLRTLEESGALALQLSSRAEREGDAFAQKLFKARAEEAAARAATLRDMLTKADAPDQMLSTASTSPSAVGEEATRSEEDRVMDVNCAIEEASSHPAGHQTCPLRPAG